MMYNVPEQETKDIEERNTQEFQCVDDFITKGIKIGSLNIKHVNRMGRYVKEKSTNQGRFALHLQRRIPYCEYSEIYQILSMQDKRGGGLMVLWKDDDSIILTQVNVAQSDILIIQCKIQSTTFTLVLVYMSVNDYNKNKISYQYIQSNIAECASYIIMGDFNGHTGFLGPHTINKIGEAMLDFIDKKEEKIWFNKTIESEIKIRKMYNGQKRVEEDKQKKNTRGEIQSSKTKNSIHDQRSDHST